MTVTVLVPRGGDCPYREAAWRWVAAKYRQHHPDWQLLEAPAPEGPWCKGAAILSALPRAEGEVLIVADADVWCDQIEAAVMAIVCGFSWAMPHNRVFRLTEKSTAAVLAGADTSDQGLDQKPYQGVWGGGIVVAHREVIDSTPLDPRFTGWG